ncbi:MAG: hypothetical protein HKN09_04640 [Saprospiraceae bacterium]|nr:hypothetical protein [Saprospiraceae bacterium]
MKKALLFFVLMTLTTFIIAQDINLEHFKDLKFRNIGPAGMSGRITAIDVNLRDKDHIYAGSASGGVWASQNGGISWKPIFDDQPTQSIGALKINQSNPDEIWVGTGEGNPRNSHNSGAGVFKSLDGGRTWKYMGLKETKLIHRIIINPLNPDHVLVGAMGSAWGDSAHRGVYMTKDGGANWEKVLYVGEDVGIADMVADPNNPNKIIAAMWQFRRTPWNMQSGGKESGLYISYNGGKDWKEITSEDGLPKGELGRMGIAFAASKPGLVYALIEAKKNGLYKSEDGGASWKLVSNKNIGNRPFYYCEIYVDPLNENRIYNLWSYVSRSQDGGKTFKTIMDYGNNVHPDHHAFWIDPEDSNYLINGNDGGLNISRDGGASWQFAENLPVGQFYHVDVDNDFPYNIYGGMQDNGSWVGPGFVLKSGGIRNYDWQELYFGDGFDVAARRDDNRYGYAMSQGGNIASWDKLTGRTEFIKPTHPDTTKLRYNWNAALALHPEEDCGLYFGSQFVHKSMDCGQSWEIISPDLTTNDSIKQDQSKSGGLTLDVTGAENHTTILCIAPSMHDLNEIWVGTDDGNLQLTRDGGNSWTLLNDRLPELPANAWIPQIELSKTNPGEAYVVVNNYRMNDWSAYLYYTSDYGATWERIVNDDDADGFVTSIVQDADAPNLLFLGTDVGLYFSLNNGQQWQKWDQDLPSVQIRDMKIQQDFDDLVLGTFGRSFYILDDIKPLRALAKNGMALLDSSFMVFEPGIAYKPNRRSYDGIRFIGQAEFVGQNKSMGARFHIWNKPEDPKDEKRKEENGEDQNKEVKKSTKSKKKKKAKTEKEQKTEEVDKADNGKGGDTKKKTKKKPKEVTICAIDMNGDTLRTFKRKLKEGMNRIGWWPDRKGGVKYPTKSEREREGELGGMPILPGEYKIVFEYGESKDSVQLTVALDPRLDQDAFDIEGKYEALQDYNGMVEKATTAFDNLKEAKKSLGLYRKIIKVQEDSIKKDFNKLTDDIEEEIDSLMHLYMLPPSDKTEYRDSDSTLNAYLYTGSRYINTGKGAPNPNAQNAIRLAKTKTANVLEAVNAFFGDTWNSYLEEVKGLELDIYKTFEPLKIE